MIKQLADAVEKAPFQMRAAAEYLRGWVEESQRLAPSLDISFMSTSVPDIITPALSGSPRPDAVALEPDAGRVRVQGGNFAPIDLGTPVSNPRMDLICGIANTLHEQGTPWQNAFDQASIMWGKLSPSLQNVLTRPMNESTARMDESEELHPVEDDSNQELQIETDEALL